MATIKFPTAEEIKNLDKAMEPYMLAIGKVATNWNYLQEALAQLLVLITGIKDHVALAIWHSTSNDRAQREMLRAAIDAVSPGWENTKFATAQADLIWLLNNADTLAEKRNNAVHAPCIPSIGGEGVEIVPFVIYRNPRAKKLINKDILVEFAWYEKSTEAMISFARQAESAFRADNNPWPDRPQMPSRGQS
jgi:hypothetical protein